MSLTSAKCCCTSLIWLVVCAHRARTAGRPRGRGDEVRGECGRQSDSRGKREVTRYASEVVSWRVKHRLMVNSNDGGVSRLR